MPLFKGGDVSIPKVLISTNRYKKSRNKYPIEGLKGHNFLAILSADFFKVN
jgi:hypothetical protein